MRISDWSSDVCSSDLPGQVLPGVGAAELGGLLDRVDGVGAGVGEAAHLGTRRLRLQQERREVLVRERVPDGALPLAAGRLHDGGHVAPTGVTERIACTQAITGLTASITSRHASTNASLVRQN